MLIHLIAAARPNFMKIAPLYHELKKNKWANPYLVHTGQHYDINMSDAFFKDLSLPEPDLHLGVGSGTHAQQTAEVMVKYEEALLNERPDLVVVVGDVNSTIAATLASVKLGIRVAHLEAGLRSFDRTMPEEINRILTDSIADILWTPSPDADENLLREGIDKKRIVRVGNIMIDSLEMMRDKIEKDSILEKLGVEQGKYCLVTLHRPANVDDPLILEGLCKELETVSDDIPILFPVHPRTLKNLGKFGLLSKLEDKSNINLTAPLNYVSFMHLVFNCKFVITDSGGVQEETTYLGIPCLTMRPNTERPITVSQGSNVLCTLDNIKKHVNTVTSNQNRKYVVPDLWDGKTALRVVESIKEFLL